VSRVGAIVMDFAFLLFITFNIEIVSSFVTLERDSKREKTKKRERQA